MGQGRRLPALGQGILLIAVAIQGITPDAHDLASTRSIVLLCPDLVDPDAGRDLDDGPDDACTPMLLHLGWPRRQTAADPRLPHVLLTPPPGRILSGADPRPVTRPGSSARVPHMIQSTCRLRC